MLKCIQYLFFNHALMSHWLKKTAGLLLIIGGVNWGLVGIFDWNLVEQLFGQWPIVVQVVYILVGLSALVMLSMCCKGSCKNK
jgi:uncharacterized membrane protein YuzA (DUF378 family)